MEQIIMDMDAMKYRKVECPNCGNTDFIELEGQEQDDFGNSVPVYCCRNCDDCFNLEEEDIKYEEGSYDEDKWEELTDEMKVMMGLEE